jgi:hypothetical protein
VSVHFDIAKIGFFGLDDWSVAVCGWRGYCIEVFSRAEQSVADCLRTLEQADVLLPRDARHSFASTRLKGLATCIKNHDFGGHGKKALIRIAEWERVYEARAFLAHGEIKATAQGITIRHISFDGHGEKQLPLRQMSRFEMLEVLADIEAAQKLLHNALGQIKALAKKMRTGPGSSLG